MKIIVDNRTELPMSHVLKMAARIVNMGNISGCTYTWASRYICWGRKNKASHTLVFAEREG